MGLFDSISNKSKPLKSKVLKAHIIDGPLILHPGGWVWMSVKQPVNKGLLATYEPLDKKSVVAEFHDYKIKITNFRTTQYTIRDGDPVAKLFYV